LTPADLKKIDGYVKYLEQKGNNEEKAGNYIDAIATYLKLVDVLLVFADAVPTYPEWVKCTTSASNYQKRVKQLIALASLKQRQEEEAGMTNLAHGDAQKNTPSEELRPVPTTKA
jgi:hypothetical protein